MRIDEQSQKETLLSILRNAWKYEECFRVEDNSEADLDAAVDHLLRQGIVVLPVRVGDTVYAREWVPCRYGQIPQSIGCAERMKPDCETCCDAYDRVAAVTVPDVAFVAENFMSRRNTYQYYLTKEEAERLLRKKRE